MLGPSLATKTRVALVGTGIRGVNMWGKNVRENYSDVVEIVGLSDINPGGSPSPSATLERAVRPLRISMT